MLVIEVKHTEHDHEHEHDYEGRQKGCEIFVMTACMSAAVIDYALCGAAAPEK
jgi:hypothetical protein